VRAHWAAENKAEQNKYEEILRRPVPVKRIAAAIRQKPDGGKAVGKSPIKYPKTNMPGDTRGAYITFESKVVRKIPEKYAEEMLKKEQDGEGPQFVTGRLHKAEKMLWEWSKREHARDHKKSLMLLNFPTIFDLADPDDVSGTRDFGDFAIETGAVAAFKIELGFVETEKMNSSRLGTEILHIDLYREGVPRVYTATAPVFVPPPRVHFGGAVKTEPLSVKLERIEGPEAAHVLMIKMESDLEHVEKAISTGAAMIEKNASGGKGAAPAIAGGGGGGGARMPRLEAPTSAGEFAGYSAGGGYGRR
jgi:hypothetical protein